MLAKVFDSPEHLIIQKKISSDEYRLIIIPHHPVLETFFLEHVKGESNSEVTVLVDAKLKNKPPSWEDVLKTILLTIEIQPIKPGFDVSLAIPHKHINVLLCESHQRNYTSFPFEGRLVYSTSPNSPIRGGERAITTELLQLGFNSDRAEIQKSLEGLPLPTTRTFIITHLHVARQKRQGLFRR